MKMTVYPAGHLSEAAAGAAGTVSPKAAQTRHFNTARDDTLCFSVKRTHGNSVKKPLNCSVKKNSHRRERKPSGIHGGNIRKRIATASFTLVLILMLILTFFINIHYLKSGSMSPAYPEGSVIISSSLKTPKLGDVCVYRHNGMTVVHRIVGLSRDGYICKGDANNVTDPETVAADDIEGVMLFGIPRKLQ